LTAQRPKPPAHLAPPASGIGHEVTSLKLTRTNQTGKTGLTCFVVYIYIPKESVRERNQPRKGPAPNPERVFGI